MGWFLRFFLGSLGWVAALSAAVAAPITPKRQRSTTSYHKFKITLSPSPPFSLRRLPDVGALLVDVAVLTVELDESEAVGEVPGEVELRGDGRGALLVDEAPLAVDPDAGHAVGEVPGLRRSARR